MPSLFNAGEIIHSSSIPVEATLLCCGGSICEEEEGDAVRRREEEPEAEEEDDGAFPACIAVGRSFAYCLLHDCNPGQEL